ncbi:pantoate--beta-alanine ligase [Streptomyces sp. NPDC056656]|uniref:pantoate--beta-alanine ligase n=1 Tax=Streptomyces sp. NPDC056656 TaxID=3345895 RepID=UPI0036A4E5C5
MRILRTIAAVRAEIKQKKAAGNSVGFVPTMGAFHEGHASLMREARRRNDTVIVSLFVNPAQFPDAEIFDKYPRDEERDARIAEDEGVDLLFAPSVAEIYPPGFSTSVSIEGELADTLLSTGLAKDGQLTGMCTVIVKLLNIVQPTTVFFGEKDLPHWIAVERMAKELNLPAQLVVLPTQREADGLAMSSRNVHLGHQRHHAACIPRALQAALSAVAAGIADPQEIRARALAELRAAEITVDYVAVLDPQTLRPVTDLRQSAVIALGARVGGVQLLDIARTVPAQAAPVVAAHP